MTTSQPYFRYCPRCATRLRWMTEYVEDGKHQTCPSCGFTFYENPIGATEAYIIKDGRVLFVPRARTPRKGYWDVPGGFMSGFEQPERAIIREVKEELGVTFTPLALIGTHTDHYLWKGKDYAVIVLSYVGTMSGRLRHSDEIGTPTWFPLNQLPKRLAFTHMRPALTDLTRYLKNQ